MDSGHALWNWGGVAEPTAWLGLSSAQQATQARFPSTHSEAFLLPALGFKGCRTFGCLDVWGAPGMGRMKGQKRGKRRNAEGCGRRDTETRMKARQKELVQASSSSQGTSLLVSCPSPFLPIPASPSVCGRGRKTKPEGETWCSRKLRTALRSGLCHSCLDKNHLALGEMPRSVLVS